MLGMEKYTELEVLISKAKSGDQEAIVALTAIMEQMEQFQ
ncbi:DNA polymerase III subunit delta' [Bacillus toyonensis]|nr:DNA polymerase III subunit delta' [Bacillus toyonensis]